MLVAVANFTVPLEAHLFRTRLQAEGIFAVVAHDHHVGMAANIAWGLGGAKVQVRREDALAARAIERDCIAGRYRAELDATFGQEAERCPHCGGADFKTYSFVWDRAIVMTAAVLGGTAFPTLAEPLRRCRRCQTEWRRQLAE